MKRELQALAMMLFLVILSVTVSRIRALPSGENWIRESIEPPTDTIKQGENFTLKVTASINQTKVYRVRIWASVVFPFMEILDADFTLTGETLIGAIYPTVLNFTRDSVNFTTYIFPPANITITATVFCSMPGSFYLPTASLWVGDVNWTEYRSNRIGPLTVAPRVETLKLDELKAEVAQVREALRQLSTELSEVRAQLRELDAKASRLTESIALANASINTNIAVMNASVNRIEAAASTLNEKADDLAAELGSVRGTAEATRSWLEREVTWLLVAALALAALSSAGAWLAAAYARRRPRPSA